MMNSRDISKLRPDVAANCTILIALCAAKGLPVLVTGTVRDEEYQLDCVRRGKAAKTATKPTFHAVKAGLAFDICKNVKGHEYDDAKFFEQVGAIGKQMGFTWGGDWKSFPDKPHFQWDNYGKTTSEMVLAGKYPPIMPKYNQEVGLAISTIQKATGLHDDTIQYLKDYKYGEDLLIKLAKAMK